MRGKTYKNKYLEKGLNYRREGGGREKKDKTRGLLHLHWGGNKRKRKKE